MRKVFFILSVLLLLPLFTSAQELYNDYQGTYRAEVLEILSSEILEIPGTETERPVQMISFEVLEGPKEGEILTLENDYLELRAGDKFYFSHYRDISGIENFGIVGVDRTRSLAIIFAVFVVVILIFGGWQGARALLALLGSFFAIFYILMPGLLGGWNPIVLSVLVASGILFAAIFFTHGFNRQSLVAYGGTIVAVFITGLFATLAVAATRLSGFAADEAIYLNFNTGGSLDFAALLLGAIIIGALGVLDDIAVTQAAVVSELYSANSELSRREVYRRALRVGREHVSALVNTLILAYTGASLPLLLYFYLSPASFGMTVNSEIFATEIVRAIVGSVGLILTVPIVTLLAALFLKKKSHA